MKDYIATYFYHDCQDLGASYGNIFLPLIERNIIYWQTVYTLFFSAIVYNRDSEVNYVLFTNVESFPFRKNIEALGVKIYDDLALTSRNSGQWATVRFFFDVIEYIHTNSDFHDDDAIVMLDTDVVAMKSAAPLFEYLRNAKNAVAYVFDEVLDENQDFHGINISNLEKIGLHAFGGLKKIKSLIGGELFGFQKNKISKFISYFNHINSSNHSYRLTTEEQILTLVNAHRPWEVYPNAIYRIWTTLRVFDIPEERSQFIFLHLPSEKVAGLNNLFKGTINIDPRSIAEQDLFLLFYRYIPLGRPYVLYLTKVAEKFGRYFK